MEKLKNCRILNVVNGMSSFVYMSRLREKLKKVAVTWKQLSYCEVMISKYRRMVIRACNPNDL